MILVYHLLAGLIIHRYLNTTIISDLNNRLLSWSFTLWIAKWFDFDDILFFVIDTTVRLSPKRYLYGFRINPSTKIANLV